VVVCQTSKEPNPVFQTPREPVVVCQTMEPEVVCQTPREPVAVCQTMEPEVVCQTSRESVVVCRTLEPVVVCQTLGAGGCMSDGERVGGCMSGHRSRWLYVGTCGWYVELGTGLHCSNSSPFRIPRRGEGGRQGGGAGGRGAGQLVGGCNW
jgi:hypothetical protein